MAFRSDRTTNGFCERLKFKTAASEVQLIMGHAKVRAVIKSMEGHGNVWTYETWIVSGSSSVTTEQQAQASKTRKTRLTFNSFPRHTGKYRLIIKSEFLCAHKSVTLSPQLHSAVIKTSNRVRKIRKSSGRSNTNFEMYLPSRNAPTEARRDFCLSFINKEQVRWFTVWHRSKSSRRCFEFLHFKALILFSAKVGRFPTDFANGESETGNRQMLWAQEEFMERPQIIQWDAFRWIPAECQWSEIKLRNRCSRSERLFYEVIARFYFVWLNIVTLNSLCDFLTWGTMGSYKNTARSRFIWFTS